jgi:hypothetical protein
MERRKSTPIGKQPKKQASDAISLPQPVSNTISLDNFEQCINEPNNNKPEVDYSKYVAIARWFTDRKTKNMHKHNALKNAKINHYSKSLV